jgi:site-specific DNA recombinase
MRCAYDGCTVTTELQKGRYVYYRCSHGRGRCSLPYMREEALSEHLGDLLKNIYVPETIARTVVDSLQTDLARSEAHRKEQVLALQQRLSTIRRRMDQIYEDKLDGNIDEEFWNRKQAEYREQERPLEASASSLNSPVTTITVLTAERIFELANKAYSLYRTRNLAERGELLKSVLLNCTTDGVDIWPTYRKPFRSNLSAGTKEDWSALADDFRTFMADTTWAPPLPESLPQGFGPHATV